jgi:hypothetical protein
MRKAVKRLNVVPMRLLPLVAAGLLAIGADASTTSASTQVPYQFDGLAFYQFGAPPDACCGPGGLPDTGYVRITNNGTSTFVGNIGFNAVSCLGIDFSNSLSVTLNPGDHHTFSFSPEGSNFGGFNGPCGGLQDGAEFFMSGTVSLGSDSQPVDLSVFDKDIHSGAPRTNPYGVTLDNYILQGGDPFGRDTQDDFETTQAPGSFQFAQVVAPPSDEPITASGTTFTATEGTSFSGDIASFTDPDPNATANEYAATIDWGDGASSSGTITGPTGGPFTVAGTHTYTEEGSSPVKVTIADVDTSTNSAMADSTAVIGDAAITSTCAAAATSSQTFGGPVASVGDANTGGVAGDFTATIDWGDGSSSQGTVSGPTGGPFEVDASHSYASTGSFTITTTVDDVGGSTATSSCGVVVFGASIGGNFVIADGNAALGNHVTFWSARWSRLNVPSGGPAPADFKGFENDPSVAPSCGTTWSSDPGSSTVPPVGPLPRFLAVIVSRSISQFGSVVSGDVAHVVVVRTSSEFAPDAGNPGTGEVVAQIC